MRKIHLKWTKNILLLLCLLYNTSDNSYNDTCMIMPIVTTLDIV